jgi:hypothetical protein
MALRKADDVRSTNDNGDPRVAVVHRQYGAPPISFPGWTG